MPDSTQGTRGGDRARRFAFAAALLAVLGIALALRFPNLGLRPMHGDEAVHAFKFAELWQRGVYHYDPNEYHGPTLYYAAVPTVWASGHHRFEEMQEADFRLATALAGAAMVPLLALLVPAVGRRAVVAAALLTAVSPAFVFYSRYFIQEVLLALFTLGALACAWRCRESRSARGRGGWLAGAAVCAGLMIATKETAPLTFAAAGVAWWLTLRKRRPVEGQERFPAAWLVAAAAGALGVAYLVLSGFFSDPGGPLGYLQSYAFWGRRGGGGGAHAHPWYYYVSLLVWNQRPHEPVWSEALILGLAIVGGAAAFARRPAGDEGRGDFLRFVAVYTLALTAIYSAIPYKTPWLVLSSLSGMILLAGAGAVAIVDRLRSTAAKAAGIAVLLAGAAHLAWQAKAGSFDYATSGGNPYVYAQPSPDVVELGRLVDKLADASPEGESTVVKVIATDTYYWPLPWYLRRMRQVGYWTALPADPEAPIALVASTYDPDEALNSRFPHSLMTGYYGLRPGVIFELWVRLDLWERYLRARFQ